MIYASLEFRAFFKIFWFVLEGFHQVVARRHEMSRASLSEFFECFESCIGHHGSALEVYDVEGQQKSDHRVDFVHPWGAIFPPSLRHPGSSHLTSTSSLSNHPILPVTLLSLLFCPPHKNELPMCLRSGQIPIKLAIARRT